MIGKKANNSRTPCQALSNDTLNPIKLDTPLWLLYQCPTCINHQPDRHQLRYIELSPTKNYNFKLGS